MSAERSPMARSPRTRSLVVAVGASSAVKFEPSVLTLRTFARLALISASGTNGVVCANHAARAKRSRQHGRPLGAGLSRGTREASHRTVAKRANDRTFGGRIADGQLLCQVVEYDPRQLHADWFDRRDPCRALADGTAFLQALSDGAVNGVEHLDYLAEAVEPVWDSREGDPMLALRAITSVERALVNAERSSASAGTSRLLLRGRYSVLRARAEYRAVRYRTALDWVLAAITWLENEVGGGTDGLVEVLRRSGNEAAELLVGVLGIYPAVVRRVSLEPAARSCLDELGLRLVETYVRQRSAPIYPRTAALASQWFYRLIERGNPDDDELIDALYELDVATRPNNARGQSTIPLREFEYATWQGRHADAERYRVEARESLDRFGLRRHELMVERYRYLAA